MDSMCRHNATIAMCSGSRPTSGTGTGRVATTREIRSNLAPVGSVRPRVIAYGRTTGPASASSQNSSASLVERPMPGLSNGGLVGAQPGPGGEVLPGPGDQHGHLVRDQADVDLSRAEHREAGTMPGG